MRLMKFLFGENPHNTDRTIAIATIVIATSAIVQGLAAVAQYNEMKTSGQQTERIITAAKTIETDLSNANKHSQDAVAKTLLQSNQAMNASNDRSKAGLDASIAASHLDERAWVGIKSIDSSPLEPNKPLSANVHFSNTGKTVALDLLEDQVIAPSPTTLDIKRFALSSSRPFIKTPHGVATLFPNMEVSAAVSTSGNATPQDIERIKSHQLVVYVFGEVHYTDIFHQRHITRYCAILNPDPNPPAFNACSTYNDAN